MNFYGHAIVAHRRTQSPLFLLGAMLPDFEGMAGQRLPLPPIGPLPQGVAFHHETDRAFHGAPTFCGLVRTGIEELGELGVARGAARAVAHVGIELLLDGELAYDPDGPGDGPYRAGLHAGQDWLAQCATSNVQHLRELLRRLSQVSIPSSYREPAFVAERLERMLAPRPRLALERKHMAPVEGWLTRTQPTVRARTSDLLAEIEARITEAQSASEARPGLTLRTRHDQG